MNVFEELKAMGYKLEENSCYYCLLGAHTNDRFPWQISKKMACEMDKRDISALKDIVRVMK